MKVWAFRIIGPRNQFRVIHIKPSGNLHTKFSILGARWNAQAGLFLSINVSSSQKRTMPFILKDGLIADRKKMLRLLECDQDEIDGRVTSVALFMRFARVDGVYPTH